MNLRDSSLTGHLFPHESISVEEMPSAPFNTRNEARDAVFTRREVVTFILDLAGYTVAAPLYKLRLLEPSFGNGDFLIPAIERLLLAWERAEQSVPAIELANAIRAVEVHRDTYLEVRSRLLSLLTGRGISSQDAQHIISQWLICGDFLLEPLDGSFDFVLGNPPYIRQELIPDSLLTEYRARYSTLYDRADIYIPFIERSLTSLSEKGTLGFICSDRWMKNRYGAPLRKMVDERFRLKVFVDMVDTNSFLSEVVAYPAITIISREDSGPTRIAKKPTIEAKSLSKLSTALLKRGNIADEKIIREIQNVTSGSEPWIFESSDHIAFVRRLENTFPSIEEVGCTVGIGVATGADKAFIGYFDSMNVEPSRKLPLVMTRDIVDGKVTWRGLGVLNPFEDDGSLVDLDRYPLLKCYLEKRKKELLNRHVAKKSPKNWYRTIDRINPRLTLKPKLLIPDIKGTAHIVFEDGHFYPHHNLYIITSDTWNLRALQAVMLSGIAHLFISAYSTKMRGGYFRFQAQYLRRIRLPRWDDIPLLVQKQLIAAAECSDLSACKCAVRDLYGLNQEEFSILNGINP